MVFTNLPGCKNVNITIDYKENDIECNLVIEQQTSSWHGLYIQIFISVPNDWTGWIKSIKDADAKEESLEALSGYTHSFAQKQESTLQTLGTSNPDSGGQAQESGSTGNPESFPSNGST